MTSIIFLLGCAQAGKDTVGAHLVAKHGYKRVSFADVLKEQYAKEQGIDLSILHTQSEEKEKHRAGLIKLAEDARAIDPLVWLNKAFEPYKNSDGTFQDDLKLVVTDCRRTDEIDWILNQKMSEKMYQTYRAITTNINVMLYYVKREEAEWKDKDILTHQCIGFTKGLNQLASSLYGVQLIDATINNDSDVEMLHAKMDSALKFTESYLFINK